MSKGMGTMNLRTICLTPTTIRYDLRDHSGGFVIVLMRCALDIHPPTRSLGTVHSFASTHLRSTMSVNASHLTASTPSL
jgi:hypothetical protein